MSRCEGSRVSGGCVFSVEFSPLLFSVACTRENDFDAMRVIGPFVKGIGGRDRVEEVAECGEEG